MIKSNLKHSYVKLHRQLRITLEGKKEQQLKHNFENAKHSEVSGDKIW